MLVLSPHFCGNRSEKETDYKKGREGEREMEMAGSKAAPLERKGGKRLRLTEFSWLSRQYGPGEFDVLDVSLKKEFSERQSDR